MENINRCAANELSHKGSMWSLLETSKTNNKALSHLSRHIATTITQYLGYAEDLETIFYLLIFHETSV